MNPSRGSKIWWGLGVGVLFAVIVLAGLHYAGVLTLFGAPEKVKPLCWVSPKDPTFIKEAPGKDPQGNDLVPVYPTPAGVQKPAGPAVTPSPLKPSAKSGAAPCTGNVRDTPGKPHGHGPGARA
jgi:hypothetical protein